MKKLRMIVTSVIVLAIVGGAFAFKTKAGAFCIKTGTTAGNCTTFVKDVRITTDTQANDYYYYTNWDGTQSKCTQDAGSHCQNTFFLTQD